jgi:4-amino-4-deoxy-L-arabinose transferase-like glycosyltransferase
MASVKNKTEALLAIPVLLLAAFSLFFMLGRPPAADWDESRHGVSAYEMVRSGDWIRNTYLGETEYWNLKPALGFWLEAASYKVFGFSTFAMRFPSALCALFTVALWMLLARRHFGPRTALVAGFILATSFGFLAYHTGRSGDFDSPFCFFLSLSLYFLDSALQKNRFFMPAAGFAFGLALLVKSFAAAPFFLAMTFGLLLSEERKRLKPPDYLLYALAGALPVLAWAYARFHADGFAFFQRMVSYDLLARGGNALEGHPGVFLLHYLGGIIAYLFPWSLAAIAFLFYGNRMVRKSSNGKSGFSFEWNAFFRKPLFWTWFIVPFVFFNLSGTKLYWYLNPLYPFIALFTAWHFHELFREGNTPKGFWLFLRRAALPLGMIALAACWTAIGLQIAGHDAAQDLTAKNPSRDRGANVPFCFENTPPQSTAFSAEVIAGYQPVVLKREEFLKRASRGWILFLTNTDENARFIASNGLVPADSNPAYLLAEK